MQPNPYVLDAGKGSWHFCHASCISVYQSGSVLRCSRCTSGFILSGHRVGTAALTLVMFNVGSFELTMYPTNSLLLFCSAPTPVQHVPSTALLPLLRQRQQLLEAHHLFMQRYIPRRPIPQMSRRCMHQSSKPRQQRLLLTLPCPSPPSSHTHTHYSCQGSCFPLTPCSSRPCRNACS